MGVKNVVKRIGQRAGDKVAKLSALSPYQVETIQLRREEYLLKSQTQMMELPGYVLRG